MYIIVPIRLVFHEYIAVISHSQCTENLTHPVSWHVFLYFIFIYHKLVISNGSVLVRSLKLLITVSFFIRFLSDVLKVFTYRQQSHSSIACDLHGTDRNAVTQRLSADCIIHHLAPAGFRGVKFAAWAIWNYFYLYFNVLLLLSLSLFAFYCDYFKSFSI